MAAAKSIQAFEQDLVHAIDLGTDLLSKMDLQAHLERLKQGKESRLQFNK